MFSCLPYNIFPPFRMFTRIFISYKNLLKHIMSLFSLKYHVNLFSLYTGLWNITKSSKLITFIYYLRKNGNDIHCCTNRIKRYSIKSICMIQIRKTYDIQRKIYFSLSCNDPFRVNIELQLSIFDQSIKFILH